MGLVRYALAFGIGYVVGHPDGRAKLRAVPDRVTELAHRPEAERLRDRGKSVADQARQAAKQRLGRGTQATNGHGESSGPAPVVAEETIVVTETTADQDTAMPGDLPPAEPGQGRHSSDSPH